MDGAFTFQTLWEDEESADVILYVGDKLTTEVWRIPAHKLVLAKSSPVFEKLFYDISGKNAENLKENDEKIIIKNLYPLVEVYLPTNYPDLFDEILRFLYTNEIRIDNVESAMLLHDTAQEYEIKCVFEHTYQYLCSNLNAKNVLFIYNWLKSYLNQKEYFGLYSLCLMLIDVTNEVFTTNSFSKLAREDLEKLTSRNSLRLCSEMFLFEVLLDWARAECKRCHLSIKNENLRIVLGSILFNVRLDLLRVDDMLNIHTKLKNLLKTDEWIIFKSNPRQLTNPSDYPFENKEHMTRGIVSYANPSIYPFSIFPQYKLGPVDNAVSFTCSEKFLLTAVELRGDEYNVEENTLTFHLFMKQKLLIEINVKKSKILNQKMILLTFPHSLCIEPNIEYVMYVYLKAGGSVCFDRINPDQLYGKNNTISFKPYSSDTIPLIGLYYQVNE